MDFVNASFAMLGLLGLVIIGLASWITALLFKVRSLENELAGRRLWWERSQRESRNE
jgi:hypothetical protein